MSLCNGYYQWDANEIVPNVWLGSVYCAEMVSELHRLGISYICTITVPPPTLLARQAAAKKPTADDDNGGGEVELFRRMSSSYDEQLEAADTPPPFVFCHVAVEDRPEAVLLPHFDRVCRFIDEALLVSKTAVLVHCMAGVSRSPTFVAAWLVRSRRMSVSAALALIQQKRPHAQPRPQFIQQLQRWHRAQYPCCSLV